MSFRVFDLSEDSPCRLSASPIENVSLGHLVLSNVLPWKSYDLKDLQ